MIGENAIVATQFIFETRVTGNDCIELLDNRRGGHLQPIQLTAKHLTVRYGSALSGREGYGTIKITYPNQYEELVHYLYICSLERYSNSL